MRALVAAEGESDEIVAEALVKYRHPGAVVIRKMFAARGFNVVLRACELVARAAHFGHFDVLIVHFDLNGSLLGGPFDPNQSQRITKVSSEIRRTLSLLPAADRLSPVKVALMAPLQSTDAWLAWASISPSIDWEKRERSQVKRTLFGSPPRGLIVKAQGYATKLVDRLGTDLEGAPPSLQHFLRSL